MDKALEKTIRDELQAIRLELKHIEEHMVDADMLLTTEEAQILDKSLKEFEEGKATRLEDFESELEE